MITVITFLGKESGIFCLQLLDGLLALETSGGFLSYATNTEEVSTIGSGVAKGHVVCAVRTRRPLFIEKDKILAPMSMICLT